MSVQRKYKRMINWCDADGRKNRQRQEVKNGTWGYDKQNKVLEFQDVRPLSEGTST